MSLNGKFQARLGAIVGTLIVTFILGGIGVVVSQAVAGEKIDKLEEQQRANAAGVQALPVIQNDLGYIKDSLRDIADYIKEDSRRDSASHHKHPNTGG